MTDEDTLSLVCAGVLLIAAIAAMIYLVSSLKAFTYSKKKEGGNISLTVKAKRNLNRVSVVAWSEDGDVDFERRRIRKGQSIDFVYPYSDKKAKLVIEAESGNAQILEV